jgi:hypothetical protein
MNVCACGQIEIKVKKWVSENAHLKKVPFLYHFLTVA